MFRRRLLITILMTILLVSSVHFASASGPEGTACLADPYGPGCTAGLPSVRIPDAAG